MRVALQKLSLVDYPGRVASVLFLPGCNLRCPYCHNPGLVYNRQPEDLIALEAVYEHFDRRQGIVSAAVISGGEPLLHPEVPAVVAALKQRGLAVKLDTNGSWPERIAAAGADYLALDIKTSPERYGELWQLAPADAAGRILSSIDQVRNSGLPYEFRMTCAPGIFGLAEAEKLLPYLQPADQVILQPCHLERVLDPAWASNHSEYTSDQLDQLLCLIQTASPLARLRQV